MLELSACASSGEFPRKKGFLARKDVGFLLMRQLRKFSSKKGFLARMDVGVVRYACASSGQFPKTIYIGVVRMRHQDNVLEREQMFRNNLCDGIRQNCI
jgi:hypothetical protein